MKEGAPFDSRLPERDQTTKSGHGERLCTHIYETFLMMPIWWNWIWNVCYIVHI